MSAPQVTQRDSLYVLDGLIANRTGIRPEMVSTDTAGASEVIFALTWALGYRWAPRLADLPDLRLWHIDRHAHYGPLDGLARNHINTRLIAERWDEICRLTASLRAGTVVPSAIMCILQRGPAPSSPAGALAELGRVIKTLHVLGYVHDPASPHDPSHAQPGRTPQLAGPRRLPRATRPAPRALPGRAGNQLDGLGIMVNVIVLWQTVYPRPPLNISPPADAHSTPPRWPGLPRSATPRSTSMAGTGPPADHPPPDSGRYEPIYSGSCTDPRHRPRPANRR